MLREQPDRAQEQEMDSGKVTVKIPAESMPFEATGAVAARIGVALQRAGLGRVVSHSVLMYEPFTSDSPDFGRRWYEIILHLDVALLPRRLAGLLVAAGAPSSSHVAFTDQMRMCGESLGRI